MDTIPVTMKRAFQKETSHYISLKCRIEKPLIKCYSANEDTTRKQHSFEYYQQII